MISPVFIIPPFLIFSAFLLLLLVTLSVPIINPIYIFRLSANLHSDLYGSGVSEWADFGVFGYCLSGRAESRFIGIDVGITELCSGTQVGYTIDDTVAEALDATELNHTISSATAGALILHPIITGLIFGVLLLSLFTIWRRTKSSSRIPSIVTTCVGCFVAFITTAVFLIDVIMVTVVRNIVYDNTDGVHVKYGNAVWMVLGAAIALWLASFSVCFACIRNRTTSAERASRREEEKTDAPRIENDTTS
ncbi:hypothetical protein BDN70DRAFT_912416 [Pholiota conissans]|uniref:Pali-domain-containing protein n=1 Tax=Pholiota conissans TaxID=109636 RepID=A0A9P5Z3Y6_9AGAR|nr:hypothetical protein BDN70DRAFT_912416 [Pholiota conissans]